MKSSFWLNKKVFITGQSGFKGGWLSLWLQSLGAEVTGFSLPPPTSPNLFEAANVADGMTSIIGDIRDEGHLTKAIKDSGAEVVIHMAAQALVRKSYIDPVETYAINVMGTVNLLNAVRQCTTVKAVVNVTSDKCYENKNSDVPFVESDPMGGYDPYSNSKGCAELVTNAFASSYFNHKHYSEHGIALASARAGNVIGGGDWAEDRLLPDIFRAIADDQTVIIRNPNAIRPWQHVLEPLSGYLTLAKNLYLSGTKYSGGWNFGPQEEDTKTVGWMVDEICQQWANNASWQISEGEHPHEANYLRLNSNRAKSLLHWHSYWDTKQAIDYSVSWQKAYLNGDDMREFSLEQISNFREL